MNNKHYRVENYSVKLELYAYPSHLNSRYECAMEYSSDVKFLGDSFGGGLYNTLLKRSTKHRPTVLPENYLTRVYRRLGLSSGLIPNISADDTDFWRYHNRSLSKSLTSVTQLVTLKELISSGVFSAYTGFHSNRISQILCWISSYRR